VERGQRMGLIKFGSRVDVLIPAEANLKVKTGSRVKGGSTVLAVLPQLPVTMKNEAMAVVA
jgi:phosphatidylserine decarboxylase